MGAAAHRSPPHHRNWHSARQTSLARLRRGDVNGWGRGLAVSGTCCSANCESCGLVQLADDASFGSEMGVGIDLRPASHRARRPQMCPAAGVLCFKSCFLLSRAPVCPPPLFFFFFYSSRASFQNAHLSTALFCLKIIRNPPHFQNSSLFEDLYQVASLSAPPHLFRTPLSLPAKQNSRHVMQYHVSPPSLTLLF